MTNEKKRQEERARERRIVSSYAPLEELEKIAREHFPALSVRIHQHGLDTMDNDSEDFFEASVWGIKEALVAAYLLGEKKAQADLQRQVYEMAKKVRATK